MRCAERAHIAELLVVLQRSFGRRYAARHVGPPDEHGSCFVEPAHAFRGDEELSVVVKRRSLNRIGLL
jgi:hypothetical protein